MYSLNIANYHDTYNKCYKKIITINNYPDGPLQQYVARITNKKLSPFQENTPCCPIKSCIYVLQNFSPSNPRNNFLAIDDIPDLFHFLSTNNYTIHENLSKLMHDSATSFQDPLLCFISYKN